jgi:protein phosphatase
MTDEPAEDRPTPKTSARPSRAERRDERTARRSTRSRVTWRVVAFVVLLLAVIGGALATIQWYGTSTYFVAFDGEEVAIFQGRPGGLLWIDPTLEDDTGIRRDEVPARYLSALEAGHEHSSLAQAQRYVSNIERDIAAAAEAAVAITTTTTTTTVPPTTAPPPTVAPPAN